MQVVLVTLGAGLAAALLFLAPVGGTLFALPLFALTGVPLAIAALGWGVVPGAIASLIGSALVWLTLGTPRAGLIFVFLPALPILWLAWVAGLSRETRGNDPDQREWYPLGRLLFHATVAVALGVVAAGFVVGFDPSGLTKDASGLLAAMLEQSTTGKPPTVDEIEPLMRIYVMLLPFVIGLMMTFVVVFDLWAADRVVRLSGQPARPAAPLWKTPLQGEMLGAFVIAAVLALALHGSLGEISRVFAGALLAGLALVGMAVLHALTLGVNGRAGLIAAAYALTAFSGLPLFAFALVGAIDPFLNFRARRSGGPGTS